MCRLRRNRRITASVAAAIMSRVDPRVFLYSVAFLLSTVRKASSDVPNNWDNCVEFDIGQLEDYLSKLSLENVPTVNMMVGQYKCPVTALPFGALKSDWARLLLLRNAQPEDCDFSEKLGRLFRLLVVAFFRIEEDFDVAEPRVGNLCSNRKKSSHGNGTKSVNREKETGKLDNSISDSGETNETARSFTWSGVLGNEESIGTINTEPTTFTSFDVVTGADKAGNSDTILNDISTTTDVASSPVGKQIDRNAIIAASDAAIRTQNYSAVSDNYSDNNAFNTETSGIDIRTVMKEGITPRAGIILANNHSAGSQTTAASSSGIETSKLAGNKIDPFTEQRTTERGVSMQPMGTASLLPLFNNTSAVSSFDVFEMFGSAIENPKSTVESVREKATTESFKLPDNTVDLIAEVATEFNGSTKQMEIDWVLFNTLSTTSSPVIEQKSTIKTAQEEATIKSTSVNKGYNSINTNSESTENKNDLITEMATEFSTATMPMRTSPRLFNDSSPISSFATLERSTIKSVQEETSPSDDRDSKKTKGRGDFPPSNSVKGENGVENEVEELKFATTRYGDSRRFDCGKSANDSKGNGDAGESCVYSDKISGNGAATSTKSFNQSPWNHGTSDFPTTPWNFSNSVLPRNKIRRPAIQKNPPVDNEFWKYIVASRKLASATSTGRSTLETEDSDASTGRSAKSKKRQSLNTNREKSFRWFYNFEQEQEEYPSNDQANEGTHIECNEKKSTIADE